MTMTAQIPGQGGPETGHWGAYCAFKNDRARLLALVSRDIRLVAIAIVVAYAAPVVPGIVARAVLLTLRVF
jgi:hypothetical protein